MKKICKKIICYSLVLSIIFSSCTMVYASEDSLSEININNENQELNIVIYDNGIKINGDFFTKEEFLGLLETAEEIPVQRSRSAFTVPFRSGTYKIQGIGKVLITSAGVVVLAGKVVSSDTWVANKIVHYFKEHTKNKRKSTNDKHTKPRPGRSNEKKKNPKKGWKSNNNKKFKQPKKGKKGKKH